MYDNTCLECVRVIFKLSVLDSSLHLVLHTLSVVKICRMNIPDCMEARSRRKIAFQSITNFRLLNV